MRIIYLPTFEGPFATGRKGTKFGAKKPIGSCLNLEQQHFGEIYEGREKKGGKSLGSMTIEIDVGPGWLAVWRIDTRT